MNHNMVTECHSKGKVQFVLYSMYQDCDIDYIAHIYINVLYNEGAQIFFSLCIQFILKALSLCICNAATHENQCLAY